ncbi:heavy metal translocating P-type ATPase [Alkalibacterium sp. 20]|uniref:heavy metal translocating P-type ATPase n=1 Tax=Alkalibacterium sp. 20 TaxID=1798803 RepID=UPI00091DC496|nr:heavy metal translocating P-type ATPase [Alkalibacterium sp. 20]OJF95361.1 ATPase [Alkalibacterium sp. 20]
MTALIKNNKPMMLTIISGLLIIVGGMLSYNNEQPLDAFVYVTAFLIGGYFQARVGFSDLFFKRKLNVDILMVLAAIGASVIGYWLEGALLIFIFSLSGSLEVYTTNKSTDAISKLMELTPETALLLKDDGSTEEVATKDLKVGNKVLVPKGSAFPIDGTLLSEYALVDEAAISGESMAVNKAVQDEVIGGTINVSRAVEIEVKSEYSDTLFAKIIRMVDEAQGTPSKTATFIESIETRYVKIVLIFVPVMMLIFYYVLGWTFNESFYRGMVLLTVASPCALMASASPSTLSAISNGAKKGVLYKGGSFLENFGQIDAIAFDKTGTLTQGSPKVTDVNYLEETNQETVNQVIVQLERISSHPLAQAVIDHLNASEIKHDVKVTEINEVEGHGVEGFVDGDHWKIGKKEFTVKDDASTFVLSANKKQTEGKTVLYVTKNNQLVSFIALLDIPAPGAKGMIDYFKSQGIHTILITGDNEATGQAIGRTVGVDEVKANCLPIEKATLILDLKTKYETIAMVGDGINDAPALANASIGIAMGAGTDLAMDAADVVLVRNELEQLSYSHKLSKRLNKVIIQNVIFSIGVILFLILANVLQLINLPLGVIGHEGSTILVILNGLRLLRPIK